MPYYDPNLAIQAKQKRELAKQFLLAGQQPQQTEMVGGMAVAQSPLAGLARALSTGLGGYEAGQANQADQQGGLNQQALIQAFQDKLGSNDPNSIKDAGGILMQDPTYAPEGVKLVTQAAKAKLGGQGGATGELANRLVEQGVDPVAAILIAKSGLGQGKTIQDGQVVPMSGAADTAGQLKYGENAGTERAKLDYAAPIASATATGKATGEAQGAIEKKAIQAPQVDMLLSEAEKLLPGATSGGLETTGKNIAAYFGSATDGSKVDSRLNIVGNALVQNVPRFEGPQSDKDVATYKAAAGDLANSNLPRETRLSAITTIRDLNAKYAAAGGKPLPQNNAPTGRVRVQTPDGKTGTIDASHLQELIAAGGKQL